jgi:hypothetical protein
LGIARFKVMGLRRDTVRSRLVFDEEALLRFTESWAEQTVGQSERGAARRWRTASASCPRTHAAWFACAISMT